MRGPPRGPHPFIVTQEVGLWWPVVLVMHCCTRLGVAEHQMETQQLSGVHLDTAFLCMHATVLELLLGLHLCRLWLDSGAGMGTCEHGAPGHLHAWCATHTLTRHQ